MFPLGDSATPSGLFNWAEVAGPLSPQTLVGGDGQAVPSPAMVAISPGAGYAIAGSGTAEEVGVAR